MTPKMFQTLNREYPVYPGHSLVLAMCIMSTFDTYAEANETGNSYSRASESLEIPGSGCSVHAALRCVERVARGDALEDVIEWARQDWIKRVAHQFEDRVTPGQEQADRLVPKFKEIVENWKGRG